ncbi:MAG: hypothetical protein F4Y01_03080 [Gammaproteobacteria bacterium]|nr:hypothetical protein [Gammaproteobacteria bacterium]
MTTRVVLLCEDQSTDTFVRRFLHKRRFTMHDIRTLPLPSGRQSGEQWVRARFPDELAAIRQRSNDFLIVVTDADSHTTAERRAQLDRECDRGGIPQQTASDRAIVVVPRRNIETWLEFLDSGVGVDESVTYAKRFSASDHRALADQLTESATRNSAFPSPRHRRLPSPARSTGN